MKYKNNPFNIRFSKHNQWFGQTTPKNGFCQFKSFDYGLRAAIVILTIYIRKGYNTVEKIISRFAPRSENPTGSYIEFVCCGILTPSTVISSIHSDKFYSLLCRMAYFETNTELQLCDIDFVISHYNLPDV